MDKLCDWLSIHGQRACCIELYLQSVGQGAARTPHHWARSDLQPQSKPSRCGWPAASAALRSWIEPAFNEILALQVDLSDVAVRVVLDEAGFVPYTLDHGADTSPEIVVLEPASPADLLSLAHEAAHAAQLILSRGSFMPPLAREACAFLGEIAFVEWMRQHEPDMFPSLFAAWLKHDEAYCGADLEALLQALGDPQMPYEYRMNYPIARAAAVVLFETAGEGALRALFAAGEGAMGLLPLAAISRTSALPPIPERDALVPATDAYRGLGVVALLDLVAENAHAQAPIAEAYDGILAHLRTGTLHVGRDDARRPVGYACWREPAPGSVEITRRVAPFDAERLDRALEARLSARAASPHASDAA